MVNVHILVLYFCTAIYGNILMPFMPPQLILCLWLWWSMKNFVKMLKFGVCFYNYLLYILFDTKFYIFSYVSLVFSRFSHPTRRILCISSMFIFNETSVIKIIREICVRSVFNCGLSEFGRFGGSYSGTRVCLCDCI